MALVLFCRKLYVCLAVTVCLLTTSLSIFFLFPRSITVLPAGLNASSIGFNATTTSMYLNMTVSAQFTQSKGGSEGLPPYLLCHSVCRLTDHCLKLVLPFPPSPTTLWLLGITVQSVLQHQRCGWPDCE